MEGDETTVLQHILECDIERTNLLEEMDELLKIDHKELDKTEIAEHNRRIGEIAARLEAIGSS